MRTSWLGRSVLVLAVVGCKNIDSGVVFDPSTDSSSGAIELDSSDDAPAEESTTTTAAVDETTTEGGETTTTGAETTTEGGESSTTGEPAACGNGEVQGGELCDDMNDVNNDGCSNDCATPGVGIWRVEYGGFMNLDDAGVAAAVDLEGNIVLVGNTETSGIRIAKYDPSGVQLWQVIDPGLLGNDAGFDVAIDSANDIVVTGSVFVENFDVWVAKYQPNGQIIWERTHSGPVQSTDQGHAVVVDEVDDIYVGGYEFVSGQGRNAWLGKYDADGNLLWQASHDGLATGTDEIASIELDVDGNVVAAGWTEIVDGESDVFVGKWDPDGAEIWVSAHDPSMTGEDLANGVGAMPDGTVIVTGATQVSSNIVGNPVYDLWIGRFDTDGVLQWETTIDGPLMGEDIGEELAVDSLGNFVVAGTLAVDEDAPFSVFNGQPPQRRGWVRKYDPDANELWTYDFGQQSRWTWAFDVTLSPDDDVFVAGRAPLAGHTDPDMVLIKVSP